MKLRCFPCIAALLALGTLAVPTGAQTISGGSLPTRWAKLVSPTNALPDYPRPQMTRARWQSLNGTWDYALTDNAATAAPTAYDGKILVPYPYEAALSGVGKPSPADPAPVVSPDVQPCLPPGRGSASCCTSGPSIGTAPFPSTGRTSADISGGYTGFDLRCHRRAHARRE